MKLRKVRFLSLLMLLTLTSCNATSNSIDGLSSISSASSSSSSEEVSSLTSSSEDSSSLEVSSSVSSSEDSSSEEAPDWSAEELRMFLKILGPGARIPYPIGLSDKHTIGFSYDTTDKYSPGSITIKDETKGDELVLSYVQQLKDEGYLCNQERSDTASSSVSTPTYIYEKPYVNGLNDRYYLSVSVSHYPGTTSGSLPPAFSIYVDFYIYPLVKTTSEWDVDFIGNAIQNTEISSILPPYTISSDDGYFVYTDRHEYFGSGYLLIDVYGTSLLEAADYIDSLETAGFMFGDSSPFRDENPEDTPSTSVFDSSFTTGIYFTYYTKAEIPHLNIKMLDFS